MSYNDFSDLTKTDVLSSYIVQFDVKTVFEKYDYFIVFALFWFVLYVFINVAFVFKGFMEKIVSSEKLFKQLVRKENGPHKTGVRVNNLNNKIKTLPEHHVKKQ